MEVSGIVFRPIPCYSGAGSRRNSEIHFNEPSLSGLSVAGNPLSVKHSLVGSSRDCGISIRCRKVSGLSEFSNVGNLRYYAVNPRCGGKKKEKDSEAAMLKKRVKMIKGLSRDLSVFTTIGFGAETGEDLIGEVRGKMLSEAAEALLAQLQRVRAEEKEMKRRKKDEKAVMKAAQKKAMAADGNTSSSSSSESSDSKCGEVVDMSRLRSGSLEEPKSDQPRSIQAEALTSSHPSTQEKNTALSPSSEQQRDAAQVIESCSFSTCGQACNGSSSENSTLVSASAERIEVCMGGKCKKSGAAELLWEFERRVGVEGAIVACKCMGKCRDGPNVRILNSCNEKVLLKEEGSVRAMSNPLCISVGLEDVAAIVENFFGEKKGMGMLAAA